MDVRTPCAKIMITYSAVALWVQNVNKFSPIVYLILSFIDNNILIFFDTICSYYH